MSAADDAALRRQLEHPAYPRANAWDPRWVLENQMGPNALWLLEALTRALPVEPGTQVLDLGCGRAMTSIFLAREFDARVWATDLWISAEDNRERIREAGVADRVTAVHAEAHALPFEPGAFDAVLSIDAYQYFGTADLYIGYLLSYLRQGGRIGIVVPALFQELEAGPPPELARWWEWEYCCFHGPEWWRRHWEKTGLVEVECADVVEDGWQDWLRWLRITEPHSEGWLREQAREEMAMLEADGGRSLGFARVVARKL